MPKLLDRDTTPDPKDLELVKTEKQNAFAISQYTDIMTIEKFAKHITSHGSVYSRADISAILYIAVDCMREMLLEGKKIRLGDLGDFSLLLTSKGAEDADKFIDRSTGHGCTESGEHHDPAVGKAAPGSRQEAG